MLYIRITLVESGLKMPIMNFGLRASPRLCQSGQIHEKTHPVFSLLAVLEVLNLHISRSANLDMHIFVKNEVGFFQK